MAINTNFLIFPQCVLILRNVKWYFELNRIMSKLNYLEMIPFSLDYKDSILIGRCILILVVVMLVRICVKVNLMNSN